MKKKLLLFFVLMATLGLFFTACEPKQPEEPALTLQGIKLNQSSVTLYEKETVKLRVRYTPEEAAATAPAVVWYSEKQRVASVDDNGLVTADRPGTTVITAQCGQFEATCTVTVTKKDLPDPSVEFNVTPKTITSPAEGGSFEITVKSNAEWTAELEADWATLSQTEGTGDATLTLTVAGTESEEPASQTITFNVGEGKYNITVIRNAYKKVALLVLDKTEEEVAVSGGSFTVNVTSEADWNVTCTDPRVTISKSGSSASFTVSKFNLTAEEVMEIYGISSKGMIGVWFANDKDAKGYKIPVTFSNADNSVEFVIYQKCPYIIFTTDGTDDASLGICWKSPEAHDFTLHIESNIPWEIELELNPATSWASVNKSSGTGDATVNLHFNENTTGSTQDGYCRIKSAGGYTPFYGSGTSNMWHWGWNGK